LHRGPPPGKPRLDRFVTSNAYVLRDIDDTEVTVAKGEAIVP
jgi:hypothetical protein